MNMTLDEKGPIQAPPRLAPRFERVSRIVQSWAGVTSATHWNLYARTEVDGADFYVGDRELGHIHLDGECHIPVTTPLRAALIAAGLARPFVWSAGWIEVSIANTSDAEHARWLFELNHARLGGTPVRELLARIATMTPTRTSI